jgi:putative transcriptional regulator
MKIVREKRKEKKLTQAQLAEMVGVSQRSISFIETGWRNPSIGTAIKLANALGVTLDELVGARGKGDG